MKKKIDLTQKHDVINQYHQLNPGELSDLRDKYDDPATNYAFDVLNKKYLTGYQIKLAAFRHIRDLMRIGDDDFPYIFDVKEENKILKFAKICPDVDTGEPTKLMPWQEFIFGLLKGWRKTDGSTRFSKMVLSVARGQGKTYLCAILETYAFLYETLGLSNQDFLVASINAKQTNKLFGYIKTMIGAIIEKDPFKSYAKQVDLSIQFDKIIMRKNNNIMRTISFESGKFDSYHFKLAVADEIGEVANTVGTGKITSGQVKVEDSLFVEISTSYPDPSVPFHNEQKILTQAMEQDWSRQADDQLCLIWAQDSKQELFPKDDNYMIWAKSNPLLYLDSQKKTLLNGLKSERDQKVLAGQAMEFQNKNMNLWLEQSADSFLKLTDVEKAVIPDFDIDGRTVYIGFDYSMMSDNTAFAFVYPYMDGKKQKWQLEQHSFIPWYRAGSIEAKEKQDGINYRELSEKGYCTITSHKEGLINDDQIYAWLNDYIEEHSLNVIFFGYDAMGVTRLIQMLDNNTGIPMEAIKQVTSYLKDPTKFLQKGFVEGSVTRLDDKIMEKALLNAEIKEDKVGIQIDKAKATLKIDVVDALVDALYQGMYHFEDFGIANDKTRLVDNMTQDQVADWFEDPDSGLL